MFRTIVGALLAFRSLGAILMIVGLGMMFIPSATADDGSGGDGLPPPACSYCDQAMGCFHANGCYCPPYDNTTCKAVIGSETDCECR